MRLFFSPKTKTRQNKPFWFFFSWESIEVKNGMNVKTTDTATVPDDISDPKFGIGTKNQILQFSLPNFCDFGANAAF